MTYTHNGNNSFNENSSYFDKELTEVQTIEVETSPFIMPTNPITPRSRSFGGIVTLLIVFMLGLGIGGGGGPDISQKSVQSTPRDYQWRYDHHTRFRAPARISNRKGGSGRDDR